MKTAARLAAQLLALALFNGCSSLRPPAAIPTPPPPQHQDIAQAAKDGFQLIFEGELRIWFHSFRAIWAVAVHEDQLSVAVLSPSGVKIMQMQGDATTSTCIISMPAAKRLQPYGEALWQALWWSLADHQPARHATWQQQGNHIRGQASTATTRLQYITRRDEHTIMQIMIRQDGRHHATVRMTDPRTSAEPFQPSYMEIRTRRPRARLNLLLKSMHLNQKGNLHAPGS